MFIPWTFSFLNAIHISKVPGNYINRKMQYSTARTAYSSEINGLLVDYEIDHIVKDVVIIYSKLGQLLDYT